MIILHKGDASPDYVVYGPSDLDEPIGNWAGKDLTVIMDGGFLREFRVLGWTNMLYPPAWSGRIEIVGIRDSIRAFDLGDGSMMMAFRTPGDEMLQMEFSLDLENWKPFKNPFPGDWNIHVEVVKRGLEKSCFFRLRKWPKP